MQSATPLFFRLRGKYAHGFRKNVPEKGRYPNKHIRHDTHNSFISRLFSGGIAAPDIGMQIALLSLTLYSI